MIEVVGYACAVVTADAMVKSNNIKVMDIEKAKGSGWESIKIMGDVASVADAIAVGKERSMRDGKYVTSLVLPRAATDVIGAFMTPSQTEKDVVKEETPVAEPVSELDDHETIEEKDVVEASKEEQPTEAVEEVVLTSSTVSDVELVTEDKEPQEIANEEVVDETYTCNLCKDPKCSRKKGEPRKACMHYEELKNKN